MNRLFATLLVLFGMLALTPPSRAVEPTHPRIVFLGDDGSHGREPFVSDGTASGTFLLRDFVLGPGSPQIRGIGQIGSRTLLFLFTPEGRHLIRPVNRDGKMEPDIAPTGYGYFNIVGVVGDRLYFGGQSLVNGIPALFSTNGTRAGNRRHLRSYITPGEAIGFGGQTLFLTGALDQKCIGESAAILSEGRLVPRFCLTGIHGMRPFVAGDRIFFVSNAGLTGPELWTSRGTQSSTRLVRDLNPGPNAGIERPVKMGRGVIFVGGAEGDIRLWFSDGTAAGTRPLTAKGQPAPDPTRGYVDVGGVGWILHSRAGGLSLLRTDGSAKGTTAIPLSYRGVRLLRLAEAGLFEPDAEIAAFGRYLYFGARFEGRAVLFRYAMANRRLERFADPCAGHRSGGVGFRFRPAGPRLVFTGTARCWDEGPGVDRAEQELWVTDGTRAGTRLVEDLTSTQGTGVNPTRMTMVGR